MEGGGGEKMETLEWPIIFSKSSKFFFQTRMASGSNLKRRFSIN